MLYFNIKCKHNCILMLLVWLLYSDILMVEEFINRLPGVMSIKVKLLYGDLKYLLYTCICTDAMRR